MARVSGLLAAIVAAGAVGCSGAAPLEAYGKLPSIEQIALSPDGKLLAVVVTNGEQRDVVVETVADQKTLIAVRASDRKLRGLLWAGSEHLLIAVSTMTRMDGVIGRHEWFMVNDLNVVTKQQRTLLNDDKSVMNTIFGEPQIRMVDGKPFVFVIGVQDTGGFWAPSLFKVDIDIGRTSLAAAAGERTNGWFVDGDGKPIAQTLYDTDRRLWTLELRDGDRWRVAKTAAASIEQPEVVGLTQEGRALLIRTLEGDHTVTHELPLGASDWGPAVPQSAGHDDIVDTLTGEAIGAADLVGDHERLTFFNSADQATWTSVARAFSGQIVTLASMSADHRKFVVRADSPTEGPAYSLVDVGAKSAHWIGPVYDGLTPDDIGPVRNVTYKAADGLQLTGYLTLPHGRDPKGLPLVVFPHGGPAARDEPGFDWWAQAMASRGYAVLQVEYRGSDGLGDELLEAGYGEFGRKMQTDLSDGVRYLAGEGIIDPKRVCIVGASYGGYAALAGATLDAGVYRCAAAIAGISDMRDMVYRYDPGGETRAFQRYWDRYAGATNPMDKRLVDISPLFHIDKVTIPILLIHGKDDSVVPFDQSQRMLDALKVAHKPANLVVLDHEDHWLSHGDTRLQMLKAVVEFLEKNNPPT